MRLKKLLKIYAKAVKITNVKDDWRHDASEIYYKIFNMKISGKVNKYLEYEDPDAGYTEDIEAFMKSFKTYVINRL